MDISIRTGNINLPKEVRSAAEEKVARLDRFVGAAERAELRFFEERNPRIPNKEVCEVAVVSRGKVLRARASAGEPLVAVERVIGKMEHRLERFKGRLISRSRPRNSRNSRATSSRDLFAPVPPSANGHSGVPGPHSRAARRQQRATPRAG